MNKMSLLTLTILSIMGCSHLDNEQKTIEWVRKSEKPIVCRLYWSNEIGNKYTLIDANGNIYNTGYVDFRLPDTIKSTRVNRNYRIYLFSDKK